MTWPVAAAPPARADVPAGYDIRAGFDRPAFDRVQRDIGFRVTDPAWRQLRARYVAGTLISCAGEPVAVAAAERREAPWVEIGWVAVSPAHRGKGLGLAACAHLVRSLLAAGETRLFGSTQDHRLAALRIYFALGFAPVPRPEKSERWRRVRQSLELL